MKSLTATEERLGERRGDAADWKAAKST